METNSPVPLPPDLPSDAATTAAVPVAEKIGDAVERHLLEGSDDAPPNAAVPGEIHDFMTRMAPIQMPGVQCCEDISALGAIMCSIMMLNSVIERTGNRVLESHALTMPQWLALGCISHAGEVGLPHSQLGQRLLLSKAPITGIVDRLERAGLVERKADARDRRVSRVVATPSGCDTWWRVKNSLRESSDAICGDCLEEAEQQQLLALLNRIMKSFAEHDPMLMDQHKVESAPEEAPQT